MKFTVTIKRHSDSESRRFQDIDPATVAAQLALWLNPTMANDVQWITVYATTGVSRDVDQWFAEGRTIEEALDDVGRLNTEAIEAHEENERLREMFANSNELPDPHGPFPLPEDPFQQLEMGELDDLLEAITFATMEVPREQRMRYANLALRVDRARIVKQEEDAIIPDQNIMAMDLESRVPHTHTRTDREWAAAIDRALDHYDKCFTDIEAMLLSLRRDIEQRLQHLESEDARIERDLNNLNTQVTDLESANEDRIRDINDLDTRVTDLESPT